MQTKKKKRKKEKRKKQLHESNEICKNFKMQAV